MEKFIPVKIYAKKWADRLMDGEIYMRPLHEFGSWCKNKEESLKNNYRSDSLEGTSLVYDCIKQNDCKVHSFLIDDGEIQYFKIFSLYRMIYDYKTDLFVKPDTRMKHFGDTAVIICDYNEFIERFALALFKKYSNSIAMISPVDFYSIDSLKKTNPLFSKEATFAYQNELRMAFCELANDGFSIGPEANEPSSIVPDLSQIKLQIGSIRDIAVAIPMDDFLNLRFPRNIKMKFPMNEPPLVPSNYDRIVTATREQMKNYKTVIAKQVFKIEKNN